MINIDLLVAGCNTRCKHCYVNGGPGPMMPVEDVLVCIEKLDTLAEYLPGEVSVTLDHEPMSHPYITQILDAASHTNRIQNYHHGMTTGIGLMQRKDRDAVVDAYMAHGYTHFGITIHGGPAHHDEMVRRTGAYEGTIAAAEYLKAQGAEIEMSLMLNAYFPQDCGAITELVEQLRPDKIALVIPIFTPHPHMLDFEPYRVAMQTVLLLQKYLEQWGLNAPEVEDRARKTTVAAGVAQLKQGPKLKELFAQAQDELYLTVHQDCKLYVGNSGAETCCLGDVRSMDLKAVAEKIRALPGNRDYGAFYNAEELPSTERLVEALEGLPQTLVYGDFESILYRGLVQLQVPTKILGER